MNVDELLASHRAAVDAALDRVLPAATAWPQRLHRAMRHAGLGGGKRLRPVLARLAHGAAGGDPEVITEAVSALELIHTYSLVHDDLPALDDDVLRRGRPTVHVAFDEATAILVGDALLTEGLLVLARFPSGDEWAGRRADACAMVGEAISSRNLIGGQVEDLAATGNLTGGDGVDIEKRLKLIHSHKTGALLRASVELGALLAGETAESEAGQAFARFGTRLGLAFQVADDILDATATAEQLGKSPGKDAETGKLTYVTLYGLKGAREQLAEMARELVLLARDLEGDDGPLAAIASYVAHRRS